LHYTSEDDIYCKQLTRKLSGLVKSGKFTL